MPDGDGGQGGAGATGPSAGNGGGAGGATGTTAPEGGATSASGGAGAVDAELAALGVSPEEYATLGDAGKRALERVKTQLREHKAKVDELSPLAEAARQAEEAKKTETEKLTTKLTAAEQRADTNEGALIRLKACLTAGMGAEQALDLAERLKGGTEAELIEDAKKLAATLAPANGQRRTTDPGLGAGNGAGAAGELSMTERIRQAAGRGL